MFVLQIQSEQVSYPDINYLDDHIQITHRYPSFLFNCSAVHVYVSKQHTNIFQKKSIIA
jgi:hypothetical protein